mgnify:CR=1 FL=1
MDMLKFTIYIIFLNMSKVKEVIVMEDFKFEEVSSEIVEVITVQDNNINE